MSEGKQWRLQEQMSAKNGVVTDSSEDAWSECNEMRIALKRNQSTGLLLYFKIRVIEILAMWKMILLSCKCTLYALIIIFVNYIALWT